MVLVTNLFIQDSRIRVNKFAPSDYLEAIPALNNITKGKNYKSDSFDFLMTDHLNDEGKTEFKRLKNKFPNLYFYKSCKT